VGIVPESWLKDKDLFVKRIFAFFEEKKKIEIYKYVKLFKFVSSVGIVPESWL